MNFDDAISMKQMSDLLYAEYFLSNLIETDNKYASSVYSMLSTCQRNERQYFGQDKNNIRTICTCTVIGINYIYFVNTFLISWAINFVALLYQLI